MIEKIKELKSTLETKMDQLGEQYGQGLVHGFGEALLDY